MARGHIRKLPLHIKRLLRGTVTWPRSHLGEAGAARACSVTSAAPAASRRAARSDMPTRGEDKNPPTTPYAARAQRRRECRARRLEATGRP